MARENRKTNLLDEASLVAKTYPDRHSRTIVLVGKFNPAIFHPAWFLRQELITPGDEEQAEIKLVHPEVSQITFTGYTLVVTLERFQLISSEPPYYGIMRDLALGTFQHLAHSPVRAVGFNTEVLIQLKSSEQWHAFGDLLTPKKGVWDRFLTSPGMKSVTIQGQKEGGYTQVTVEPSNEKPHAVKIRVNDHFEALDSDNPGAYRATEILNTSWDESCDRSDKIIQELIEEANQLE